MSDMSIDMPRNELVKRAEKLIENGVTVFFKFTCGGCGARQTFDVPNTLYTSGTCEECGHITEIEKGGFMAMFGSFRYVEPEPKKEPEK